MPFRSMTRAFHAENGRDMAFHSTFPSRKYGNMSTLDIFWLPDSIFMLILSTSFYSISIIELLLTLFLGTQTKKQP